MPTAVWQGELELDFAVPTVFLGFLQLSAEVTAANRDLAWLTAATASTLLARPGTGPITVVQLLITAGSSPERRARSRCTPYRRNDLDRAESRRTFTIGENTP